MFWFILGKNKELSAAEIAAVLKLKNYEIEKGILKTDKVKEEEELIKNLGGTIKICKELSDSIKENELINLIIKDLSQNTGKIHFGISIKNEENDEQNNIKLAKRLGLTIKKELKQKGMSVRYVENKTAELSSVVSQKNKLIKKGGEFYIEVKGKDKFSLAKTTAIQPFESFSKRDFGRPGRDDLSGMLPPKLSIMMINLTETKKEEVLLDPFCGSGTVLTEALLMGYTNLIGSDLSPKAIEDTKKNVDWTIERSSLTEINVDVFEFDVKELSQKLDKNSVDSIATEPFLGKPVKGNEKRETLERQKNDLKELYIGAFKEFSKILKPKAKVIFIIPRFRHQNEWLKIDAKKEIEKQGFKTLPLLEDQDYILYWRESQHVGREVWRFEKI